MFILPDRVVMVFSFKDGKCQPIFLKIRLSLLKTCCFRYLISKCFPFLGGVGNGERRGEVDTSEHGCACFNKGWNREDSHVLGSWLRAGCYLNFASVV